MKIAVLHWPTSSVGGINSRLQVYREVALRHGDNFHVLVSDNARTKHPELFSDRRRIRGGDSFIVVDGTAPHHEANYRETLRFLSAYDCVMLSFLCPHPTKAYGSEPAFLPLLKGIAARMPIVGYISDAYWDTYADFGREVLPLCAKVLVAQKAYGEPLVAAGYPVQPVYLPFTPLVKEPRVRRDTMRLVWTPQWKPIKGVSKFFSQLPRLLRFGFNVGLYNNGIEYYYIRQTPLWKKTVDLDRFIAPDVPPGPRERVEFHGCVPLEEIPGVLTGAAFMCDFQGHSAKHAAYLNGSYNNTINEALYYGCIPVVHRNMLKSEIPAEFLCPVDAVDEYPEAVAHYPVRAYPRKRAREFVEDHHNADRLYERIFDKEVRRAVKTFAARCR